MKKYKSFFEQYLDVMQKTGDIALRLHYQHQDMMNNLLKE